MSSDEQTSIITELERRHPGYPPVANLPMPMLQAANIAAVADELTAENPTTPPAACQM